MSKRSSRAWKHVFRVHLLAFCLIAGSVTDGQKSVRWEDVDAQLSDYGTSTSPLQAGLGHCMQEMLSAHCAALHPPLQQSGKATGSHHTGSTQPGLCGMELELSLEVADYSARHGYVHEVQHGGVRVAHFSVFPSSHWEDFVAAIQVFSLQHQQGVDGATEGGGRRKESVASPKGRLRLLDTLGGHSGSSRLSKGSIRSPPALRPQLGKCGNDEALLLLFFDVQPFGGELSPRREGDYDTSTTSFIRSAFPAVSPLLHDSVTPLTCGGAHNISGKDECLGADVDSFLIQHYGEPVGRVDRHPLEAYDDILEEHNSWQGLKQALDKGGHSGTMDLSLVMANGIQVAPDKVLRSTATHGALILEDLCSGDADKDLSDDPDSFGFMHCLAALEVAGKGMADMHLATAKSFDLQLIGNSWPRLVANLLPESSWQVRVDDDLITEREAVVESGMAAFLHSFTSYVVDEVVKGYQAAARSATLSGVGGKLSLIHNDVRLDNMLVVGDFMFSKKPQRPGTPEEGPGVLPRRRRQAGRWRGEGDSRAGEQPATAMSALSDTGRTEGEAKMAPLSIKSAVAPAPSLLDIHKMSLELTDFAAKNEWGSSHLQRVIQHFRSSYSSVYQQELQSSQEEVLFRLFALQGLLMRVPGFTLRKLLLLDSLKACSLAVSLDSEASSTKDGACRRELSHLLATDTKFYPAMLLAIGSSSHSVPKGFPHD